MSKDKDSDLRGHIFRIREMMLKDQSDELNSRHDAEKVIVSSELDPFWSVTQEMGRIHREIEEKFVGRPMNEQILYSIRAQLEKFFWDTVGGPSPEGAFNMYRDYDKVHIVLSEECKKVLKDALERNKREDERLGY